MGTRKYNCIAVLGPTASGKTKFAAALAYHLHGEIISADSRQVYRHLDVGTGKDLHEYVVNGRKIPFHLINVCDPFCQFYLHDYIRELSSAFHDVCSRKRIPVICGGTGLYLDALRKDFELTQVPENPERREELEKLDKEALLELLTSFPDEFTRHVDLRSKKRLVRGIEVAEYRVGKKDLGRTRTLPYLPYYIGLLLSSEKRRERIGKRLRQRLHDGLLDEVEALLAMGVTHDRLQFLGLEYKFISLFLRHQLQYEEMVQKLETAINQFAKRQMTWFRKMEKEGVKIHWTDPETNVESLSAELRSQFRGDLSV